MFGRWIPGFRITGLLLNGLAALALLRLLRRLTNMQTAWLAAVLFAVHPAHAEAVSMAYGQLELLAAIFGFLALDQYVQAVTADSLRQLVPALVLAFLAACSKESAIMLFALAALIRGFLIKPNEGWRTRWFSRFEVVLGFPGGIVFGMRMLVLQHVFNRTPPVTAGYPLAARVKTVVVALGTMVELALYPSGQTLHYGHLRFAIFGHPWTQTAWILAAVLLAWTAARAIGRRPVLFGVSWFVVALFPVLNVIPALVLAAERNLYLPLAGVVFVAATWICNKQPMGSGRRVAVAVLLATCVVVSNAVAFQWRDGESAWRNAIKAHPDSPMAHLFLGEELDRVPGREAEAAEQYRIALRLNPGLVTARRKLEAPGR